MCDKGNQGYPKTCTKSLHYVCHASTGTVNPMQAIVHGGWYHLSQILKQALMHLMQYGSSILTENYFVNSLALKGHSPTTFFSSK